MTEERADRDLAFSVLFVCTGNICRSPMGEVAFGEIAASTLLADGSTLASRVRVASAGTANWHVGSEMDPRARAALDRAGYRSPGSPARHATPELVTRCGLAVAMDRGHLADLRRMSPATRASLLLEWGPPRGHREVADPYYGTDDDFTACLEEIQGACRDLASCLAAELDDLP